MPAVLALPIEALYLPRHYRRVIKKQTLTLATAILATACTAQPLNSPKNAVAPATALEHAAVKDMSSATFSYEIGNKFSVQGLGKDESAMKHDGLDVRFKKRQIIVKLHDETQLHEVLGHLKATAVDQQVIPIGFGTTGSKEDGTFRQLPPKRLEKQPVFLLDVPVGPDDDVSGLDANAKALGIKGRFEFNGVEDASLFNKTLELRLKFKGSVKSADQNLVFSPATVSQEGYTAEYARYEGSPNAASFWFAGGTYWYKGANLTDHFDTNGWSINSSTSAYDSDGGSTGSGVIVAVIDFGFQGANEPGMPDGICQNEWTWNTAIDDNPIAGHEGPWGREWHGRGSASLIFSRWNDGQGTIGAAPGAQPLLIHIDSNLWDTEEAIRTASNNSAKVINCSFGDLNPLFGAAIQDEIGYATDDGAIFVASAGNENQDTTGFPGGLDDVICVGALNPTGGRWDDGDYGSNYGSAVDIWAPGKDVAVAAPPYFEPYPSQHWGTHFVRSRGTSLAAPIVSGVVAALVAKGLVTNTSTAKSRLLNYATTDYPIATQHAPGKALNALKALRGF